MKEKSIIKMVLVALMATSLVGCSTTTAQEVSNTEVEVTSDVNTNDMVAKGDETIAPETVVGASAVPIYGDELNDGTYEVEVVSSSSMFKIVSCELNVSNGTMTATLTMSSSTYKYMYMGSGEQAVNASEGEYIPLDETDNTFTIPVQALDYAVECSAFSGNKEKWYDRSLCFTSSSLPTDALKDGGSINTVESLNLADGEYYMEVTLEGGSGRASVETPTKVTVDNGVAYAEVTFSSPNYDYAVVDGEKYLPIDTEGNSTFIVPVLGFDYAMPITADTTAMSTPHEIDYTLYFDSSTICE